MPRPPKEVAIERLRQALISTPSQRALTYGSPQMSTWETEFAKWKRDAEVAIANTFPDDPDHLKDFRDSWETRAHGEAPSSNHLRGLRKARAILESMIAEVEEYWEDTPQVVTPSETAQPGILPNSNQVFVIHGSDHGIKSEIARFLENLGLEPVILHEQADQGRTIIEKFEQSAQAGFAVALLTPDDVGGANQDNLQPRARQNVILELGYFIGKLGRSRVCALRQGDVEIPSDISGVLYIPLDDAGGWQMALIRELKNVGFNVDANRAFQRESR